MCLTASLGRISAFVSLLVAVTLAGPRVPLIPAQRGLLFIQKEKKQKSHVTQSHDRRRRRGAKAQTEATEGAKRGSNRRDFSVNRKRQEPGLSAAHRPTGAERLFNKPRASAVGFP